MRKIYNANITKIDRSLNGTVVFVYLAIWDMDKSFEFKAGQFVVLSSKIWWQVVKRSYSIGTTMNEYKQTSELGFIIKLVPEGIMSTYFVKNAKIWDELEVVWPAGRMYCEPTDEKLNYLLISSWSGLSPLWSIYNSLVLSQKYNKIINIFGERTKNDLIVDFESDNNANITNIVTLSREMIDWYYQWYVQKYISKALSDLDKSTLRIYICGKPAMVDEVLQILESEWINNQFIYFEKY